LRREVSKQTYGVREASFEWRKANQRRFWFSRLVDRFSLRLFRTSSGAPTGAPI